MKKLFTVVCALVIGITACIASMTESTVATTSAAEVSTSVSVPTGIFFNDTDFIKVENGWVRICINRQSKEYDFRAEMDPYGNYALVLSNGESITIYSNGRTLYYGGNTYSKK